MYPLVNLLPKARILFGEFLIDSHLGSLMIEFRPHRFHDLTEALQILTHVLQLDSLLLIQKLKGYIIKRLQNHTGSLT